VNVTPNSAGIVITAVIVTHNSPPILKRVVEGLLAQTVPPRHIVIVDSGSRDAAPVAALSALSNSIEFIGRSNIGFAAANNLAIQKNLRDTDFFALVNPDVVLAPNWFEGALTYLNRNWEEGVGMLASPLRGMDTRTEQPTGLWDSLGIYRHPSGRWYDRGQLQPIDEVPSPVQPYEPTAMVGALLFFSANLVERVATKHGFFDERYFTFKEDVELSLRVREKGLRLVMLPELTAHHCRGWPKKRLEAPYWTRRLSAVNDVRLAASYFPWRLPIYIVKFAYVATVERWLGIAGTLLSNNDGVRSSRI
jgi:GT2 family glycosyltransferase